MHDAADFHGSLSNRFFCNTKSFEDPNSLVRHNKILLIKKGGTGRGRERESVAAACPKKSPSDQWVNLFSCGLDFSDRHWRIVNHSYSSSEKFVIIRQRVTFSAAPFFSLEKLFDLHAQLDGEKIKIS